jgi:hypothetical protein
MTNRNQLILALLGVDKQYHEFSQTNKNARFCFQFSRPRRSRKVSEIISTKIVLVTQVSSTNRL